MTLLIFSPPLFWSSSLSEETIVDIIASLMVLPNRMCIPLIDQVKVDQMRFPLPRVWLYNITVNGGERYSGKAVSAPALQHQDQRVSVNFGLVLWCLRSSVHINSTTGVNTSVNGCLSLIGKNQI